MQFASEMTWAAAAGGVRGAGRGDAGRGDAGGRGGQERAPGAGRGPRWNLGVCATEAGSSGAPPCGRSPWRPS